MMKMTGKGNDTEGITETLNGVSRVDCGLMSTCNQLRAKPTSCPSHQYIFIVVMLSLVFPLPSLQSILCLQSASPVQLFSPLFI